MPRKYHRCKCGIRFLSEGELNWHLNGEPAPLNPSLISWKSKYKRWEGGCHVIPPRVGPREVADKLPSTVHPRRRIKPEPGQLQAFGQPSRRPD